MIYDIIIIGAGTAGMTAALYARRAGKTVLVLESENFGGQISYTPKVENYPGIKQVSGAEFASNLFDQILSFGAEFDMARAEWIAVEGDYKTVFAEGKEYRSRAVIIAVGVKPRKLGLQREDELLGEGVCYCAVCDGAFYMEKTVAVAGGGNSALTDALFLSAYCSKVYLIHRRDTFSAEKALIDRINEKSNIEIILESNVSALLGEKFLTGVEVLGASGNRREIDVAALFVAAGHVPNNACFGDIVALDKKGFILAENCLTSAEGIFAAGDCRAKQLRQLTTAVSDGAVAGIAATKYVK